jgi:hypothetical protein
VYISKDINTYFLLYAWESTGLRQQILDDKSGNYAGQIAVAEKNGPFC